MLNRGFLFNYPPDVVYVVNGHPVTRADILTAKRERQRRELEWKRRNREPVIKPCFIWTFYNDSWIYGGWWLYVRTLKESYQLRTDLEHCLILRIMQLFPCGHLPMLENYNLWKADFARTYHYPITHRPDKNGMAIAWAQISPDGILLDVLASPIGDKSGELTQ